MSSLTTSNTAAILYGPRDIRIEDRTIWAPDAAHVQIQVASTGLCGSDLHYYSAGRNGDFAVRAPLVLGHESAGTITALGAGVAVSHPHLRVGQRVAIEAGISCRNCAYCEKGRYNLCKGMRFCSSAARFPHVDGTLQERMNHPAFVVHPLPDTCTFEHAALAEPLSVLIHASRRCRLTQGQSVLVFGVGAIGLLACALAKHRGASRVVAVDINPQRLEFAKTNGFADDVFCLPMPGSSQHQPQGDGCCPVPPSSSSSKPTPSSSADEALRRASLTSTSILTSFAAPDGFDTILECTGSETCIQSSVFCAATGGTVMLIGMGTRAAYMPLSSAALREVDVMGSFRYAGTYAEALDLLASQTSNFGDLVSKLVTHRFRLEDTKKAFEMLRKGVDEQGGLVLKVMVGGAGVAC